MMRDMVRLYILYSREEQDRLVARLQQLGVLHLEHTELEGSDERGRDGEKCGKEPEARRQVESALVKAHGVLELFREVDPSLLEVRREHLKEVNQDPEELARAVRDELGSLEDRLRSLVVERRELRDRLTAIRFIREILQASQELLSELPADDQTLLAMVGEDRGGTALDEIRSTLEEQIPGRYALAARELSEDRVEVLASVDPEYEEAVGEYFEAKGFRHVSLPSYVQDLDFSEAVGRLQADSRSIPERLDELEGELRQLGGRHAGRMVSLTWALENRMAQLEAAERFGYTGYALLISGWLPADELAGFKEGLAREFPGIVVNEDPSEADHEEIPVAYQEPPWSRPYKLFLDLFGTPKHGSVDPVPYISVFFPIFFALIVGDVGYGLVILALAGWGLRGFAGLRVPILNRLHRVEAGEGALRVTLHSGAFTVAFGLIFGEVFGIEVGHAFGWHLGDWWPLPRVHEHEGSYRPAGWLLPLTLAFGGVQVIMGLGFGIAQALRHGHRRHAAEKLGLLLALIGFTLAIGDLSGRVPPLEGWALPGALIVAAGIPLMAMGGVTVLLEMLTPFIHMLSYARLMGFAVAAVMLAIVFNRLIDSLAGSFALGIVVAAVAAVVLHTFNLVLHIFEGAIQSARLHWVEFFEKFILEELGGVPYRPFREVDVSNVRDEP